MSAHVETGERRQPAWPSGNRGLRQQAGATAARYRIRGECGFTLIELLVALVIFATMAAIAYAGLEAVSRSHARLSEREAELSALGRSLSLIERDLRSLAARPVQSPAGTLPAMVGAVDALELSSFGRGRAAGVDLGLVERIGYRRDSDGLHRLRWPVLDRLSGTVPDQRLILPGLEQLRWRFLAADGRWHDEWPPRSGGETGWPRAVEYQLMLPRLGELRRLVELPQAVRP